MIPLLIREDPISLWVLLKGFTTPLLKYSPFRKHKSNRRAIPNHKSGSEFIFESSADPSSKPSDELTFIPFVNPSDMLSSITRSIPSLNPSGAPSSVPSSKFHPECYS